MSSARSALTRAGAARSERKQTAARWAAWGLLGAVLAILAIFLLVQLHWTWRTEGVRAAGVLLFTSFVIFPPLVVLEIVESILFPARRGEQKQAAKSKWSIPPIRLAPGTMCALDGIVTHRRIEQADNAFAYRVRYYLVPLDAPPASFSGDHLTAEEARAFADTGEQRALRLSALGVEKNTETFDLACAHLQTGRCSC